MPSRTAKQAENQHDRGSRPRPSPGPLPGLSWCGARDSPAAARRRDPWRAATPSQPPLRVGRPFIASEDLLCLSSEDDRRPPANKTLSVSLQRMTYGPLRGRGPGSGGWRNTGPCVSPPKAFGGEQEGSCDAGILRFPHRLRPSVCGRTSCSGRSLSTIVQECQNRRGPMIHGHAGCEAGAGARAGWCGVFRALFGRSKRGILGPSRKDECTE